MVTNMQNLTEVKASTESIDTILWEDQPTTSGRLIPSGEGQSFVLIGTDSYSGYGFDVPVCNTSTKTISSVYLQNLIHYHSISTELHLTVKEVQPCIRDPGVHWSGDVPIIQKQLT